MSILGSIISSVLGSRAQAAPPPPAATPPAEERHAAAPPAASHETTRTVASAAPPAASQHPPPAPAQVDVAVVLDKLAKEAGQKLDWRRSIVDLMKLVNLDSGLAARKTLAKELSYTGDTQDSATMNKWLHKQVMAKLAQNGGKLPDDLKPDKPETKH